MRPTRLDYCQFLLISPINHTITYFADHLKTMSHDSINRFLSKEKMSPSLVWDNVRHLIEQSRDGYVLFDDTIIDKNYSHAIELVRRQYSGNAHAVIKGIGVVTCVYVNPRSGQHWVLDYRIFDPDGDGKSKIDHVKEMLTQLIENKGLLFKTVLMDTWYATKDLMLFIESKEKIYYCPLKCNRLVKDSDESFEKYRRIDTLDWSKQELEHGKTIKIRGFPNEHRAKLFRIEVSTHQTEWVVTNDLTQNSSVATQQACGYRWKIEQFHRETKQLTGIERCQCRKARIQRNHIACAMLVWVRLAELARQSHRTLYQVKNSLLDDFVCQQLKNPSLKMRLA